MLPLRKADQKGSNGTSSFWHRCIFDQAGVPWVEWEADIKSLEDVATELELRPQCTVVHSTYLFSQEPKS